jgi:hypothetical protein
MDHPISIEYLDFVAELGGDNTGQSSAKAIKNASAFDLFCSRALAGTTRHGIKALYFRRGYYDIRTTRNLHDLQHCVFIFEGGPTFNESAAYGLNAAGTYFMWNGAAGQYMFDVDLSSAGTNQNGLHWVGNWNMGSEGVDTGYGIRIANTNNWGGIRSGLGFVDIGSSKRLARGIATENTYDNAHGLVGFLMAAGISQGAIYAIGGGFAVLGGNISVDTGQTCVYIGPDGSEMKLYAIKLDGGGSGAVGVDCRGAHCLFDGVNFEGFNGGTGVDIHRTVNNSGSGRYNTMANCMFTGHDGTMVAWKARHDASIGTAGGNVVNMNKYSNCVAASAGGAAATMLPNGASVFDVLIDYNYMYNVVGGAR